MQVLALNCGGSSVKFKLLGMPEERVLAWGSAQRIGTAQAVLECTLVPTGQEAGLGQEPGQQAQPRWQGQQPLPGADYSQAVREILEFLSPYQLDAVGHRVVHGGEALRHPVHIDAEALATLRACIPLAPLHNPANIAGIEAVAEVRPEVPQVAICDNTFHLSLPPRAYLYGVPYELYRRYGIRRYGFHGITFAYMVNRAAQFLGRQLGDLRIVNLMLGSGTTANAFCRGRSVDVSTGLTPTEGLLQSTRCGDIDPGVLVFLLKTGTSLEELEELINRQGGWLGISGVSNDYRQVEEAARAGNERAQLALEVLVYRIKKYVGAYAAAMGGIDALVFSGGIGESSSYLRQQVCRGLEFLGIEVDAQANQAGRGDRLISPAHARAQVLVVHTDEEVMIARETVRVLEGSDSASLASGPAAMGGVSVYGASANQRCWSDLTSRGV